MNLVLTGEPPDVAITARDADALVHFYGQVLRLPLNKMLDWPNHHAKVWFFSVGKGHLKIVHFDDVPTLANPSGGNRAASGFRYVTIHVSDVDEALRGIEEAGGRVQRAPQTHGDSRVAFLEDPEGNTIELVARSIVNSPGRR
ncbi:VOC family protein [Jatrophihabitans sp. DSM 45814]